MSISNFYRKRGGRGGVDETVSFDGGSAEGARAFRGERVDEAFRAEEVVTAVSDDWGGARGEADGAVRGGGIVF